MKPVRFPEANGYIPAPPDRPNAHPLPILRDDNGVTQSVWQMSTEELALANQNGGLVTLIVVGQQPAVVLKVDRTEPIVQEATTEPTAAPGAT